MLPIMTGTHVFHCTLADRGAAVRASVQANYGVTLPTADPEDLADAVPAVINNGRWIINCPDCNSAEYLWPDEPIFLCTNCFNAAVAGRWRAVMVPKNRLAIEAILRARPVPANRNWKPGDTLAALRAENREHGLPEGGE